MSDTKKTELIEEISNRVISEFSKTLEMFSLNTTESQLFVTLFLNDGPMTLDDMKESLGKSKTAMSNAVRTLLDFHLVERVWKKGVRKDLYQVKQDLYEQFIKTFKERWLDSINAQINSLNIIKERLHEESPSLEQEVLQNKISEVIDFHKALEKLFSNINESC